MTECLGSDVFPKMWRWNDISWLLLSFYFFLFMQPFSCIFFRFIPLFSCYFSHLLSFGFLSSSQSFLSSVKLSPFCFSAKDVEARSSYTYNCSGRIQGAEGSPKTAQWLGCGLEAVGICGSWFEASTALYRRSVIFWKIARSRVVIPYQRFGTTYCSHL